ncbi:MAG TPA: hypothetical protein VGL86_24315 [Polyangia bacterium]|jgi:hypothetical protein
MPALSLLAIALVASSSLAAERPLVVPSDGVSAEAIEGAAARRGLEVARPQRESDVAAESTLAEVRPLYRDMAFARAVTRLQAAEQALVDGRLPTPRVSTALAEIETWIGACLLLDNKRADALERFALARVLSPTARPDRIFPPEVPAAFARATPGPRVTPRIELSPPGARLWIDGQLAEATTTAGVHWILVERADRRPVARVVRVTQAAPEIAVSLADAAAPADAVRQVVTRAAIGPLGSDEALAVSAALGRTLWIVGAHAADRFSAADVTNPSRHLEIAGDPVDAVCAVEPMCLPLPAPHKPLYKRAVLWVPVAAGVVLAVGAGVLAGTLANASSDYVVRVH